MSIAFTLLKPASPGLNYPQIWYLMRRTLFLVHTQPVSHSVLTWQIGPGNFLKSLCKGTNPVMKVSLPWPSHLPKAPPSSIVTLGMRLQPRTFGGIDIQYIAWNPSSLPFLRSRFSYCWRWVRSKVFSEVFQFFFSHWVFLINFFRPCTLHSPCFFDVTVFIS